MSTASHLENMQNLVLHLFCPIYLYCSVFPIKLSVPAADIGFAVIILFYIKKKKSWNENVTQSYYCNLPLPFLHGSFVCELVFQKGSKVISWFIAFILAPLMSKSYCFLIHETRNSHIYYFHFLILRVYQVQGIENNHIKKLYFCTQGKYKSFVRQKIKKIYICRLMR